MLVDDITPTLPAATPLSRSLSKSVAPREHCQKSHPTPRPQGLSRAEDDISVQSHSQVDDHGPWFAEDISTSQPTALSTSQTPTLNLEDLPPEILEIVAGHVVGRLGSARAAASGSASAIRNWNDIMRHPRRRNISDLALISRIWRRLIQERLFRHSKLNGLLVGVADDVQSKFKAQYTRKSNVGPFSAPIHIFSRTYDISRSSFRYGKSRGVHLKTNRNHLKGCPACSFKPSKPSCLRTIIPPPTRKSRRTRSFSSLRGTQPWMRYS